MKKEKTSQSKEPTRRDLVKTALYVAPVVLTLTATPAFAKTGTGSGDDGTWDTEWD